jgi:hypothetical protein
MNTKDTLIAIIPVITAIIQEFKAKKAELAAALEIQELLRVKKAEMEAVEEDIRVMMAELEALRVKRADLETEDEDEEILKQ